MTNRTDSPPGVRLMTDGGRPPGGDDGGAPTRERTVHAKAVDEMEIGGEQREVLRVPISSTRPDREGDRFSKEALEGMADQIREEKPLVFQNHGLAGSWMDAIPYDQSETIGTHHDAEVEEADDGEYDLMAMVNPDGTHPEGERMLKQVRDEGQAVKFSVGFNIHGYESREDVESEYQGDGRVFTSVDLMEDSKVGVPANPDASAPVGASAKSDATMPGYARHPMVQLMTAMGGGSMPPERETAVKSAGPDAGRDPEGDSDELDTLRGQVEQLAATVGDLRAEVEALRGDDAGDCGCGTKEEGDPCDDNGDCGDGMECVDGECVPMDDGDDGDEEDATEPDDTDSVDDLSEDELREELRAARESIDKGTADPESSDTTTEDPDLTEGDDPEADDDGEPDAERAASPLTQVR